MSLYRNVVWFTKGLREYTKSGYESAAKQFVSGDLDVDCSGLSYMITGANSGIGKQAAIEIAKRGYFSLFKTTGYAPLKYTFFLQVASFIWSVGTQDMPKRLNKKSRR